MKISCERLPMKAKGGHASSIKVTSWKPSLCTSRAGVKNAKQCTGYDNVAWGMTSKTRTAKGPA